MAPGIRPTVVSRSAGGALEAMAPGTRPRFGHESRGGGPGVSHGFGPSPTHDQAPESDWRHKGPLSTRDRRPAGERGVGAALSPARIGPDTTVRGRQAGRGTDSGDAARTSPLLCAPDLTRQVWCTKKPRAALVCPRCVADGWPSSSIGATSPLFAAVRPATTSSRGRRHTPTGTRDPPIPQDRPPLPRNWVRRRTRGNGPRNPPVIASRSGGAANSRQWPPGSDRHCLENGARRRIGPAGTGVGVRSGP